MIIPKKADVPLWLVVSMVLILIFLVLYSTAFAGWFRKSASELDEKIGLTDDKDEDGVINFEDKCPCPPNKGDFSNFGCPTGYKVGTDKIKEDKTCLKKKNG